MSFPGALRRELCVLKLRNDRLGRPPSRICGQEGIRQIYRVGCTPACLENDFDCRIRGTPGTGYEYASPDARERSQRAGGREKLRDRLSPAHLLRLAKACLGCAAAQLAKACHLYELCV